MNLKILFCLLLVLSCGLTFVHADVIPGVDWHVANAERIELVQAETLTSVEAFPSPQDIQRVWVKQILKGVDTTQTFLLPKASLKPGQMAVVLFQYAPPAHYEPALQSSAEAKPAISIWPMNSAGNVDTRGIAVQTQGGPDLEGETKGINLDLIKKNIATITPEEVGLNAQVLDALLFPKKFQALERLNAKRATYIRFAISILDLNRDLRSFARLLESQDQTVRTAALKKLEVLTGTHNQAPKDKSPRSLHEWAQTWAKQADSNKRLRWPPVPAALKAPVDAFPEPLIEALRRDDADRFAIAFAAWLDSGAMRDREIHYAATLDGKISADSNLAGATGLEAYLPPAPRLRPDLLLETNIPAIDRMKAIALLAELSHGNRFAQERMEAVSLAASVSLDSDILHRAAFWELRDSNVKTAGRVALNRLAQGGADGSSQRFVLAVCLNQLDADALDAVRIEIKSGRQTFVDGLFAYLGSNRDQNAQFIARLLCQEKQTQVIPVMLGWLKSNETQMRKTAALNLCWLPSADAVSSLLDAIHTETDPEVKAQMLVALAQIGDKRGLEALLAAVREPGAPDFTAEIVRGLGRIRDDKALAKLADLVSELAWIVAGDGQPEKSKASAGSWYLLSDAVNAFGYTSHIYKAHPPDSFWSSSTIQPAQLRLDIARIEEWRKSQAGNP